LRVTLGFVIEDGDEFVAVRIFAFDVGQRRADGAGQVAALDRMAGQAIALAAIESQLLPLGGRGLRADGSDERGGADQQRQHERLQQDGTRRRMVGQRRFPQVYVELSVENIGG
jgi:hypothetical protein